MIILYALNFACYLQWFKWIYRRFFDLPYTWFMTNIDNKFTFRLFAELKLILVNLISFNDSATTFQNIVYKSLIFWNVDSLCMWKFIKLTTKIILIFLLIGIINPFNILIFNNIFLTKISNVFFVLYLTKYYSKRRGVYGVLAVYASVLTYFVYIYYDGHGTYKYCNLYVSLIYWVWAYINTPVH